MVSDPGLTHYLGDDCPGGHLDMVGNYPGGHHHDQITSRGEPDVLLVELGERRRALAERELRAQGFVALAEQWWFEHERPEVLDALTYEQDGAMIRDLAEWFGGAIEDCWRDWQDARRRGLPLGMTREEARR